MSHQQELGSLHDITTRREAVERCIGPLSALAVISWFDETHSLFGDGPSDLQGRVIEQAGSLVARRFHSSSSPVSTLGITDTQLDLFDEYTYARRNVRGGLQDTLENQMEVLDTIVVPGFIAAEDSIVSVEDARSAAYESSAERIGHTLLHPSLLTGLKSMSFAPNGTYEFAERLSPYDVFKTPQSHLRAHTSDKDLLRPITTTGLFIKRDGQMLLSPRGVKILRAFLKLDNEKAVRNDGDTWQGSPTRVHSSRGCPASIKTVPMRQDDLTEDQWEMMTNGDNPVGRYNATDQLFTLLRSPITEHNRLLSRIIYHQVGATVSS